MGPSQDSSPNVSYAIPLISTKGIAPATLLRMLKRSIVGGLLGAALTLGCAIEFDSNGAGMGETGSGTEGSGDSEDTGASSSSSSSSSTDATDTTDASTGSTTDASTTSGDGDTTSTDETEDTGTDPVCGNGIAEEGEECDGEDMGTETCEAQGFSGGDLSCLANCYVDVTLCVFDACPAQPEAADFSACDTDADCGDPDLYCIDQTPSQMGGYCSRDCAGGMGCALDIAYLGCGPQVCNWTVAPVAFCVMECDVNADCPAPMVCEWSIDLLVSICM